MKNAQGILYESQVGETILDRCRFKVDDNIDANTTVARMFLSAG